MKYSIWLNRGEEDQGLLTTEWSLRNPKILRPRDNHLSSDSSEGFSSIQKVVMFGIWKPGFGKIVFFSSSELLKTYFHNVKIIYSQTMPISLYTNHV